MAYLSEKAAYLRGLCEGMKLEDTDQNKLLKAIIEALDDMSFAIEELEEQQEEIFEELDEINEVCLLYTSPSPRDRQKSRMPSSA